MQVRRDVRLLLKIGARDLTRVNLNNTFSLYGSLVYNNSQSNVCQMISPITLSLVIQS